MTLVSMKTSKKEDDSAALVSRDPYPLTIYLGSEEVDKLKLAGAEVGDEMMLVAKIKVTSVSSSETLNDDAQRSVTLSVLEAGVEAPSSDGEKADKMFKKA